MVKKLISPTNKVLILFSIIATSAYASSWDPTSRATNTDSIANTRHNLSTQFLVDGPLADGSSQLGQLFMEGSGGFAGGKNNYGEVCVYCHTPHGANSSINAPLWNHTLNSSGFTPYQTNTGQTGNPGISSLMCLSCHDGTVAIDSIINMPGSGGYNPANATGTGDIAFLDSWNGPMNNGHATLATCGSFTGCHGDTAADFDAFVIGKDLRNDHPVGVNFPGGAYWNDPAGIDGSLTYFETGGNPTRADKNEVRLYDGTDEKVECGSCHDPHGVESAGPGSIFIGSFLRVDNASSALCLTCHDK